MSAASNEQPFRGSVIRNHEPGSSQTTRSGSALLSDRIGRCCRPLDGRQGGCRSASDHPGSGRSEADVRSASSGSKALFSELARSRSRMGGRAERMAGSGSCLKHGERPEWARSGPWRDACQSSVAGALRPIHDREQPVRASPGGDRRPETVVSGPAPASRFFSLARQL